MVAPSVTMAAQGKNYLLFLGLLVTMMLVYTEGSTEDKKVYIVYMGSIPSEGGTQSLEETTSVYHGMLESVHGSNEEAKRSLMASYGKSFRGFAAMLSPSDASKLRDMDGVISVFESETRQPWTTRSWDFVGLNSSVHDYKFDYQANIVIGIIDTGIWPESESFSDRDFDIPPPARWKGACQVTSDFPACNKKLIGAKYFRASQDNLSQLEYRSPRDAQGHGTHTSSTAAGNFVKNANLFGIADGLARGGVPGARVAMYKVCWVDEGCKDADIFSAFDEAINDGVDILSVSFGTKAGPYTLDSVAIGGFHAAQKGILVSASAGNAGPDLRTLGNVAPWILTVAATTIDRRMDAELVLGNNQTIKGIAVNTYTMEKNWYPLVFGGNIPNLGYSNKSSQNCEYYSLDPNKVSGNIVLCYFTEYRVDYTVYTAGGAGTIVAADGSPDSAEAFYGPATKITRRDARLVLNYIASTRNPIARIQKTTNPEGPAPRVASFSSRGPNNVSPDIMKPDIAAPGVNILASFSPKIPLSTIQGDTRNSSFNILSGTSMACPHASGAAGWVKAFHKDWSPAAVKSALLTTATTIDRSFLENGQAELAYGAGQINPWKATDPGLIYDAGEADYVHMLCRDGYSDADIKTMTGKAISCIGIQTTRNAGRELNYPTIFAYVAPGQAFEAVFPRTVTNVGVPASTYKAAVFLPAEINATVTPDTLTFSSLNQKLSFTLTLSGGPNTQPANTGSSGYLTWSSGNYNVRSAIYVYAHST